MDAGSMAEEFGFDIFGGSTFVWNSKERTFTGAKGVQPAIDGKVSLRIFGDTVSIEVFVNGTYVRRYIRQTPVSKAAAIVTKDGTVRLDSLKIHTLRLAINPAYVNGKQRHRHLADLSCFEMGAGCFIGSRVVGDDGWAG